MHLLPVTPCCNDDRIHILEVIGNASMGGMENYLINFLTHLPKNQFRVTCICPYESAFTESLRKLGVTEVYVTPIEDNPLWSSIQFTIEIIRLHKIDVLHAHMPKAHVLAGIAARFENKPIVATVHGMEITAHEFGIARAVNSYLITNCQEAYSQALALGVSSAKLSLVRNGIDTTFFKPAEKNDTLRREINVPLHAPLVGFAGRLDFEKGPDLFLQVAEYVHRFKPEVHFVVAGEGSMRKELDKLCARFKLHKHVHFLNWIKNISEIYNAVDVLAHTSRTDGTSLVLLEAMACGCPVVALDVGGVREIIENGSTGILAAAEHCEGVGYRIIELLENAKRRQAMCVAARARVEKYFNVETNTLRTAEILRNIAFTDLNGRQFNGNGAPFKKKSKTSAENAKEKAG